MKVSGSLQHIVTWYEARPLRERIMLLLCLLVVLFFIWDSLVMSAIDLRKKKASNQVGQLQVELIELAARQQLVEARKDFDPDRKNRELLQQLQADASQTRQQLEDSVVNLISPREMPELLKDLLLQQQQLKLQFLENLPAEPLQMSDHVAERQLSPVLYRHRLKIEFSGDYLATLAYLNKLETLPRRLVWEELEIETQDYPQARVRLHVYTLSLSKGWIGG